MITFSLDEIALFDRCLFPVEFKDELIEHGVDEGTAISICYFMKRHQNVGIVKVYQEFVLNTIDADEQRKFALAIDSILQKFFKRNQELK